LRAAAIRHARRRTRGQTRRPPRRGAACGACARRRARAAGGKHRALPAQATAAVLGLRLRRQIRPMVAGKLAGVIAARSGHRGHPCAAAQPRHPGLRASGRALACQKSSRHPGTHPTGTTLCAPCAPHRQHTLALHRASARPAQGRAGGARAAAAPGLRAVSALGSGTWRSTTKKRLGPMDLALTRPRRPPTSTTSAARGRARLGLLAGG